MCEQVAQSRGTFLLLDGLDGIGKGVFLRAMQQEASDAGMQLFDLHTYWKEHGTHPSFADFEHADIIFSSEPCYVGEGKRIREKLIKKGSNTLAAEIAAAYARDREALYTAVLIPALQAGIHIIQSRGISASIAYQPLDAELKGELLTLEEVKALPGNQLALSREWAPDLLVIPTVNDPAEVMCRLAAREKNDEATFERLDFQQKLKERFESEWFKELFAAIGTEVIYADASISIEKSQEEARRIFRQLFSGTTL